MEEKSVHQFEVQQMNGEMVSLKKYRNKVLVIVNTASDCSFTPQLKELEAIRDELGSNNFEVLAFPSNDFGGQEPLHGEAIIEFCEKNYNVHFPVFEKIRVRGSYAHPLYRFLSDKKQNGHVGASPRWNFHKYLINRNGEVVDFFYPFTKPGSAKMKKRILRLINAPA